MLSYRVLIIEEFLRHSGADNGDRLRTMGVLAGQRPSTQHPQIDSVEVGWPDRLESNDWPAGSIHLWPTSDQNSQAISPATQWRSRSKGSGVDARKARKVLKE